MTSIIDEAANHSTYFSHKERMFPELGLTDERLIPTEQFLRACQGIAEFVGFLGVAFVPVKNDIAGNVHKVRTKFDTDRQRMQMLQYMVDIDLAENGGKMGTATEGLLWLKRGLEFMLALLRALVRDYQNAQMNGEEMAKSENLSSILSEAYEKTLKRHHNFVSRQIFKVVLHAAPYRRTLLLAIAYGHEGLEPVCVQHISELLANFEANVTALVDYYCLKKLDSPLPPQQRKCNYKDIGDFFNRLLLRILPPTPKNIGGTSRARPIL